MTNYALAAFIVLLPTYLIRFSVPLPVVGTLPTTLLELLFWALFATWIFTDGRRKDAWQTLAHWALPLTLFMTGSLVALAVSPDLRGALGLWRAYILEPILFFVMVSDVLTRARRGTWILIALGATLALVGKIAIFQKLTGYGIPNAIWQAEETRRVTAFYGFPNAIGLMAAPIAVLMVAWGFSLFRESAPAKRLLGFLAFATALLGTLGIIFAVSQGAMIGLAAGLAVFGLLEKRLRAWTLSTIILACGVIIFWTPARDQITQLATLSDDSGSVRRIIWSETAAMLADHPVFGAGLSGYPGRIAPYHLAEHIEIFQYPHNIFLNFWSELGLIGLAGFLWIVGRFYAITAASYKNKPDEWLPAALIAAMTALLVHGLVDVPYFKNDLAMLFWTIVALAESMRRLHRPFVTKLKETVGL